jgi:hypothetical protein
MLFSPDKVTIRCRNKIEAFGVKGRQLETASSVQGRTTTVRSGRRDKCGPSFYTLAAVRGINLHFPVQLLDLMF